MAYSFGSLVNILKMKKLKEIISKKPLAVVGGTLLVGLLLGWLFFGGNGGTEQNGLPESHSISDHEAGTIWTCSMHPQIREDEPGNCPICGMELIPLAKKKDNEDISPNAVVLSASAMKIAEVETSVIKKKAPYKEVVLPGMVKADERRIHELTAHFPGRIEKLYVNFTGQKVRKGQVLATIFSPELVTAQKELFEAIKYKESNPQFYTASRNKLKLWLFTDKQIDEIEESGEVLFYFKILSPGSGTVTKRNIAQGDHVMEGMSMFQIIDLRHLWLEFDAYESDIPWIKLGSKVNISIKSVPGKVFKSKVTFIDPVLNEKTRTTVVRAELDNKQGILRPGMFAQASIQSMLSNKGDVVMVPKSAVLWTGKRAVVYIKEDHGETFAFHYREITLGEDTGTYYVVEDGLHAGEEVVTNGAFKIDAAAQLKGSQSMMNPEGGKVSTGMAGMDMGGDSNQDTGDKKMDKSDMKKNKQPSAMVINPKFKAQFTDVVNAYLDLKEAFVSTDSKKAAASAKAVKSAMDKVKMELLKGDAHLMWMDMMKPINSNLDKIIASSDIEVQRLAFADLSEAVYNTIKMFKVSGLNINYQFCPMARDGGGAYWLSLDSEIRNPYYGEAMLTCGETKETIK